MLHLERKYLNGIFLLSTIIISGKGFFNHLACSVASYHANLWVYITHVITTILLWSFYTIKLQARVLATTVGFTKQLAKTLVLFTHNLS
jgi:hypothetical protein